VESVVFFLSAHVFYHSLENHLHHSETESAMMMLFLEQLHSAFLLKNACTFFFHARFFFLCIFILFFVLFI
jgi:hypothetical protein